MSDRLSDEDLTKAFNYANEGDGTFPPVRARGWIYALVDECRARGAENIRLVSKVCDSCGQATNRVTDRPPLPTLDELIDALPPSPTQAPYEGLTAPQSQPGWSDRPLTREEVLIKLASKAPQSPSQAFMKAGQIDEAAQADLTAIAGLTPSAPAVHWDTWNARLRELEARMGRLGSIDIPLDAASNDRVDLLMAKIDVLTVRADNMEKRIEEKTSNNSDTLDGFRSELEELSRLHEDLGGRVEKLEHLGMGSLALTLVDRVAKLERIQSAVDADAKLDEERHRHGAEGECPGGC